MSLMGKLTAGSAVVVGSGLATLGYALWEARQYTVREVTVTLPRVTNRPGPLRVLHLSDLHLSPRDQDRIAWIRDLETLSPDVTVVTGDLCGDAHPLTLVLDALEPLLGRAGMYVRGSNDYYSPRRTNPIKYFKGPSKLGYSRPRLDVASMDAALTGAGWIDLDNASETVHVAGWSIDARGVDDPHIHLDNYADVAGPFEPEAMLRLGVAHAPYRRVLDAMAADDADLILAGHTHGGQVCVPGFGALVTNCDLPRAQAKGLSRWRGSYLNVSAGLGTSPTAPIRVACRPEATLLTVH